MSRIHFKYVLAGGGVAAGAAAAAIRAVDPISPILIVGQEPVRPYHRSPLSKAYLARRQPRGELFSLGDDWYAAHAVQLRTGRRVAHLDTARHAVTLDDGQEIGYDRLLLATGAAAAKLDVPGAALPNLYYVRTLADVDRLGHAIDVARAAAGKGHARAAVIGGGVLGVELVGTLTELGLAVTLVAGGGHPWRPFAGEPAGAFVSRHLARHGVDVRSGRRAVAVEGDGRVQRVRLDDGATVACDLAVAAVGSVVQRDLLRNTPVRAETAILVDDGCRTSEPHVFAAGDCCALLDGRYGKHRVVDHYDHAVGTGATAGTNMAGGSAAYAAVNRWTTEVLGLSAVIFGEPKRVERRVVRGPAADDSQGFVEIGIEPDGRVAQVLAIGRGNGAGDVEGLQRLVADRVAVAGREEELKDPAVPLAAFG
jgi:3-phenylpropionate/trans-cinnamate dioxygenase ferredoxin reductase subunit